MIIKLENGEVHYINKLEDFQEVIEPEIYDTIEEFIDERIQVEDLYNQDDKETDDYIAELEENIDDLEDRIYKIENIEDERDKYYNTLETVDNKVKEILDYINKNNDDHEKIIENIKDQLEYIRYDTLSGF